MKKLIKPKALKPNDTVATISLSAGLAGAFPKRYEQGKRQLTETFGLHVIETPHALDLPQEIYEHPENRLADFMWAFQNPEIKAIICNIGGSDTNRLFRLMNESHFEIIHHNPKIFMGFSDTTVNHFMCYQAGITSFYGPCILFSLAENGGIPDYTIKSMQKSLFSTEPVGILPESPDFIIDTVDWSLPNTPIRPRRPNTPWRYIQGTAPMQGRLFGGCFDSLIESLNGTSLWPSLDEFKDTILFLEICEDMPTPQMVQIWLRLLGVKGILNQINGILFARPGNDIWKCKADADEWVKKYPLYDKVLLDVCKEFDCTDIPIVTNLDFGHTMPQFVIPYGALCEINPINHTVAILESGVQ